MGEDLPLKKATAKTFKRSDAVALLAKGPFDEVWKQPSVFSYMSILEDVVEAFFGRLVMSIEESGKSHGIGVQIAHNILHTFFDAEKISIYYKDVFDAISRLKELYESKILGYRWPFNDTYEYAKSDTDEFTVKVYGWPLGDKTPIPQNRMLLAVAKGYDKDRVKEDGSNIALDKLANIYKIVEKISDPGERMK
jgi:hypothetical protein